MDPLHAIGQPEPECDWQVRTADGSVWVTVCYREMAEAIARRDDKARGPVTVHPVSKS